MIRSLALMAAAAWGQMARMLARSWDIRGRERFNFDTLTAHRTALRNKRWGGIA